MFDPFFKRFKKKKTDFGLTISALLNYKREVKVCCTRKMNKNNLTCGKQKQISSNLANLMTIYLGLSYCHVHIPQSLSTASEIKKGKLENMKEWHLNIRGQIQVNFHTMKVSGNFSSKRMREKPETANRHWYPSITKCSLSTESKEKKVIKQHWTCSCKHIVLEQGKTQLRERERRWSKWEQKRGGRREGKREYFNRQVKFLR